MEKGEWKMENEGYTVSGSMAGGPVTVESREFPGADVPNVADSNSFSDGGNSPPASAALPRSQVSAPAAVVSEYVNNVMVRQTESIARVKPGWKTSETQLFACVMLVAVINKLIGLGLDDQVVMTMILSSLGYGYLRGTIKRKAMALTSLCLVLAMSLLAGCARFSTTQIDRYYNSTNKYPSRVIKTRAGAYTLWASESALANWKAAQTDKSQTASVGTILQQSDVLNSNVVQIIKSAVDAYLKSAIPLP